MAVIDLKSHPFLRKISGKTLWGYTDVCRTIDFQAGYGLHADPNLSPLRAQIPWRVQSNNVLLSRPVSLHGFCPDHSPRKSTRYRDLSAVPKQKALSHGHSRQGLKINACRCQRKARLAYIHRVRTNSYCHSQRPLSRRFVSRRTGRNSICSGLNHDRSMFVGFPMGNLSQKKGRCQTPYVVGPKGKHTNIYPYFRRYVTRCQRTRSAATGSRRILRYGSRVPGLRKTVCLQSSASLFRNSSQSELSIQQALFTSGQQRNRASMRSNDHAHRFLHRQTLSGCSAPYKILRCPDAKNIRVSYQQLLFTTADNSSALSQSMASRAVFQMDQTASEDQELLWHLRKCSNDTSLDSSFSLCSRGNHEKAPQPPGKSLHNFTDFERIGFRKNIALSAGYRQRLQKLRPSTM